MIYSYTTDIINDNLTSHKYRSSPFARKKTYKHIFITNSNRFAFSRFYAFKKVSRSKLLVSRKSREIYSYELILNCFHSSRYFHQKTKQCKCLHKIKFFPFFFLRVCVFPKRKISCLTTIQKKEETGNLGQINFELIWIHKRKLYSCV